MAKKGKLLFRLISLYNLAKQRGVWKEVCEALDALIQFHRDQRK